MNWSARNRELRNATKRNRFYTYKCLKLRVERDVFPPDLGFSSKLLADLLLTKRAHKALDMGTGTLLHALVMRLVGIEDVWAIDNHISAVRCAQRNLEAHPHLKPIHIIQSNLCSRISEKQKFDLVVFNQPYYPIIGKKIAGMGADGGKKIIIQFLMDIEPHLLPGGEILMPYSTIACRQNNPGMIARYLGWNYKIVKFARSGGYRHFVYSITHKKTHK